MEAGTLAAAFNATQALLRQRRISAGHDISDGGIAVTLLEMAFAGNTGIQVGSGFEACHHVLQLCRFTSPGRIKHSLPDLVLTLMGSATQSYCIDGLQADCNPYTKRGQPLRKDKCRIRRWTCRQRLTQWRHSLLRSWGCCWR